MDRKTFLKLMCGAGACGCVAGLAEAAPLTRAPEALDSAPASGPEGEQAPDQRLAFARYQVAKLAGFMAAAPPSAACAGLLEQTGGECAKIGGLAARFTGNPEGYFAEAAKAWGTEFQWDKARGVITVAIAEGPCGCPLVDAKRTPAFWCHCSVGYQKASFGAIFGRPVQASLKESKLSGSKRCVFEVRLAPAG